MTTATRKQAERQRGSAHRPLLEPGRGRRRNRKITITDDRWEQAKELGKGSASEGIAAALDHIGRKPK